MDLLTEDRVEDLAVGSAVLGTGGGGNPYLGKLMTQQAIRRFGPVRVISRDEVGDDDVVIPTAMMGAPTVFVEKLPRGDEYVRALEVLQSYIGQKAVATMSIEIGGLNSTLPLSVSARMRLPILDADGMGRAFPEVQMVTPTLWGISATPMAVADERGNFAIINTIDNFWAERISRSITIDMGAMSGIALFCMTGRQAKEAVVWGSISFAERIGRTIREARRAHADPVEAAQDVTGGFRIFKGKIVDVKRRTEKGFAKGDTTIEGLDDFRGQTLRMQFQNELLVAIVDGDIRVTVPDLITVLDSETGSPITTEELRYGFRVTVLGIPCAPQWRTEAGLKLTGPRYFGYEADYIPVEARYARAG